MVATKDFAIGDSLLQIPYNLLITLEYCETTKRGKELMNFYPNNVKDEHGDAKMKNDM